MASFLSPSVRDKGEARAVKKRKSFFLQLIGVVLLGGVAGYSLGSGESQLTRCSAILGLRDRAFIGVTVYTFGGRRAEDAGA